MENWGLGSESSGGTCRMTMQTSLQTASYHLQKALPQREECSIFDPFTGFVGWLLKFQGSLHFIYKIKCLVHARIDGYSKYASFY